VGIGDHVERRPDRRWLLFPVLLAAAILIGYFALRGGPGAAQQPLPGASDGQPYPAQCSLPLQLSARAYLSRLRLELQPSEGQRPAFDEFDTAVNKAVDDVRAICTSARYSTPTEKLQTGLTRMTESLRAKYQYSTCAQTQKLRASGYNKPMAPLAASVTDYVEHYLVPGRVLNPSDASDFQKLTVS